MAYTTINKSTDHFNTKLYTGNGSTQSITGVGFQPDFTWIKSRNDTNSHFLFDAVRGATKLINSNTTNAESTQADTLTSFDSDGFSLGDGTGVNGSSDTEASWNWKAGGGQGSSNTDGTINTTYTSVNTTAGFSISKYTGNAIDGATIGHGLGVVPQTIWIKRLSSADGMICYHHSLGNTTAVKFDRTDYSTGNFWNSTTPTNQVVTVTGSTENNYTSNDYVMYAFAPKQGYSKFGKYTGNGNADGPFIYTGFKPAFVIIKDISQTRSWIMVDNKRNTFNVVNNRLFCDAADAQNTAVDALDFLSNGFKIRSDNSSVNVSGNNYIYMCFAEVPLVGTNNVPATAR